MPSQQSSFKPTRTAFACHERMTWIEATSAGPSNMPQPRMHAYSAPERFTPIKRTGCPSPVTSLLPSTLIPFNAWGSDARADGAVAVVTSDASSPRAIKTTTRTHSA